MTAQTKSGHSPAMPRVAELLLKFPCSACDQILNVGIERSREISTNCPRCETPIQVPTLDRSVGGVEQVLRANPETLKHDCPRCGTTSKVPLRADLSNQWKCRGCGVGLAFQIVLLDSEHPRSNQSPDPPPRKPQSQDRQPKPKPQSQPPAPPQTGPRKREAPAAPEPEPEEIQAQPTRPAGVEYHGVPRQQFSPALDFLSNMPPRTTAWIIWAILQFPGFILLTTIANLTKNPLFMVLALVWIIPRIGICSLLTYFIMSVFMRTFRCPHCHEEYEAVGRWGCSCGYVDHRERHFYRFKCPMCKSVSGHISCQRCEATMILR